jgi:hypothetical protein
VVLTFSIELDCIHIQGRHVEFCRSVDRMGGQPLVELNLVFTNLKRTVGLR